MKLEKQSLDLQSPGFRLAIFSIHTREYAPMMGDVVLGEKYPQSILWEFS
jgi:hypothetical protein